MKGKTRCFFKQFFLNKLPIHFARKMEIKKYWKLATMFQRDVSYIFRNWSCKKQLYFWFDIWMLGIDLWKQNLKRIDGGENFIGLH